MRILHVPSNVANQAWYAAEGVRAAGHEAEVWEFDESPFGFRSDRRIDAEALGEEKLWELFVDALDRFDVFHLHFGRSFFPRGWGGLPPLWDLPLLRALRKKVVMTWHGQDCAIQRIHLEQNPWSYFKYSDMTQDDDRVEKQIQIVRTYVDEMFVVSVDYKDFIPDATWMPRIVDLREWPEQPAESRAVPRVLHIPSRRGKKGSAFVIEAMANLEREGVKADFRLVEGMSHADAAREIAAADIVVDNVITGDYEVVSIEAMASNRVAVANVGPRARAAQPGAPVVDADPETFAGVMRDLIRDRSRRQEIAARGRAYVAATHDAPVVGRLLAERYAVPARAPRGGHFPDWMALTSARKTEALEERFAQVVTDRDRAALMVSELKGQLAAARKQAQQRARLRDVLPLRWRKALKSGGHRRG